MQVSTLEPRPGRIAGSDVGPDRAAPSLEALAASFTETRHRIHIACDPALTLSSAQLNAVVTIAGEAIANAIEHAFPDGRAGDIWVRLTEAEGRIGLMVRDNGAGMPDLLDLDDGGRALIHTLARQLGGYARLGSANFGGAEVLVKFPRAPV